MRKLTHKEAYDLRTMRYFIPDNKYKNVRISKRMEIEMADSSSRGIKPKRQLPKAFQNLQAGKTYRELHITMWRQDIAEGYLAKWELMNDLPKWLRPYIQKSLRGVGPGPHVYKMWKDLAAPPKVSNVGENE